jgi:hypothetical protein
MKYNRLTKLTGQKIQKMSVNQPTQEIKTKCGKSTLMKSKQKTGVSTNIKTHSQVSTRSNKELFWKNMKKISSKTSKV